MCQILSQIDVTCNVAGWFPPGLRVPHPVTMASWPVYTSAVSQGRQAGATDIEKFTGVARVRMLKSFW